MGHTVIRTLCALMLLVIAPTVFGATTALPGASGQHAIYGSPFPNPIGVRVTDDAGNPVVGQRVVFYTFGGLTGIPFESNIGRLDYAATTDRDGIAVVPPTLQGTYAGTAYLYSGFPLEAAVRFDLITDPRLPVATMTVEPSSVVVEAGTTFPIVARFLKADGSALAHATLSFVPDFDGVVGSFDDIGRYFVDVVTDENGYASAQFTPSLQLGNGRVSVGSFDAYSGVRVVAVTAFTTVAAASGARTYQDMWWGGPDQDGWGLSLVQHGERFFGVLYVYDEVGEPTWYAMPSPKWYDPFGQGRHPVGIELDGSLYHPSGSSYHGYDVSRFVPGDPVGGAYIRFAGPDKAFLGLPQQKRFAVIGRQDFTADAPSPMTGLGDIWWGGEGQNGWGIAILEQKGALFSVWLTYDDYGKPTWFVMPSGEWRDASTYSGTIYRATNRSWVSPPSMIATSPYDPGQLRVAAVGRYTYRFRDRQHATFDYVMETGSGTLELTRQPF